MGWEGTQSTGSIPLPLGHSYPFLTLNVYIFVTSHKRSRRITSLPIYLLLLAAFALASNSLIISLRLGSRGKRTQSKVSDTSFKLESPDVIEEPLDTFNAKKFPCHYITNRADEFEIVPHFLRQQKDNHNLSNDRYSISIATMISPTEALFERLKES